MIKLVGEGVKVVLFDHDDTLVATIGPKGEQHKHIARTYYNKELTDEEIRGNWGKPLTTLLRLFYGTENLDEAVERIKSVYHKFPKEVYDDTMGVLEQLHAVGKKIGIVTSALRFNLDWDLKQAGIPKELFDYIQTEEDTPYHKPDPRVFEPALRWLGGLAVKPEETVYIGDGLQDMQAALGAGFQFIGVSTGLVSVEEFKSQGARVVKKLGDLI